jgi:hypothetical protein
MPHPTYDPTSNSSASNGSASNGSASNGSASNGSASTWPESPDQPPARALPPHHGGGAGTDAGRAGAVLPDTDAGAGPTREELGSRRAAGNPASANPVVAALIGVTAAATVLTLTAAAAASSGARCLREGAHRGLWSARLPAAARAALAVDVLTALATALGTHRRDGLTGVLHSWAATADLLADPATARRLTGPLDPTGDLIPRP